MCDSSTARPFAVGLDRNSKAACVAREVTATGERRIRRLSWEEREALWDANDVASYLKASRSWVYQKAEAGLLPCLRIGGLLRFDPVVIRAFAGGGGTPRLSR